MYSKPIDINTISEETLKHILQTNGVESRFISSLIRYRNIHGWIWSDKDLLLCGIPDTMLPWFKYHFFWPSPPPPQEFSPDLADFLLYPADLNQASPSALQLLPKMTEERIISLLSYRKQKGFSSPKDLLNLGWSTEEIQSLAPFITISPLSSPIQWHHALRFESFSLFYRTTLLIPYSETYLILPSPHTTSGNLFTILTQAVFGTVLSSSWGNLFLGDFRYKQGNGLLFGSPFSIISRHPSEMIVWDTGFSRPYTANRDQNNNRIDEILRGVSAKIHISSLTVGAFVSSNQLPFVGGFINVGKSSCLGVQIAHTISTNTPLWMGSSFGKLNFSFFEAGGEYAFSREQAWIIWTRTKGILQLAIILYRGDTNFFAPVGGKLYRNIPGRTGALTSLFFSQDRWEILFRSEWYTNKKTIYTTFKTGIEPALNWKKKDFPVGINRISFPFSLDNRTNQLISSYGFSTEGWLLSPLSWETKLRLHHYKQTWGYEYHVRTSLKTGKWHLSLWYSFLIPLHNNPISLTFPPIESGEMESMWFDQQTDVICATLRYNRKELSMASRLLLWEQKVRFALSVQWMW